MSSNPPTPGKALTLIFPAALAALLLGACGGGDSSSRSGGENTPWEPSQPIVVDSSGEYDPIASPEAVPGGTYTTWGGQFPKSLNMWLDYNSFSKQVMAMLYEPLVELHSTENEPVGVLADSWEISEDKTTFTFKIDPRAKWSDGKPVTAHDVQFYYDVMMNPQNLTSLFRVGLSRFDRPEVVDETTVRIKANQAHWSNFWEAAGLVAFPKHAWEDSDFNTQNFDFPVVSGPYRVGEVRKGRTITLARRGDWWGQSKRYNQNKYNFAQIRYRFMEDRIKALEAFKKGDFDAYPIYTASIWAEQTDFEQVGKGYVAKLRVFNKEPIGFQGFALNLRRPIFQDRKVRLALAHLLNRELMNEKLMYNQYFLLNSYYPDLYPNNRNPDAPLIGYDPAKARELLKEAGWSVGSDGQLAKDGRKFEITIPTTSTDLRHLNVYVDDLKKIGITARVEQISQSAVRTKLDQHDFDMYWMAWGAGRLRDPEPSWHSRTAMDVATNNVPGVKDPIIDSLVEAQKTEMDLDKRNAILKQIDSRLNDLLPYVLLWQSDNTRLLFWNKFGTPKYVLDKFNREDYIPVYWWFDAEKENQLKEAMKSGKNLDPRIEDVHFRDDVAPPAPAMESGTAVQ